MVGKEFFWEETRINHTGKVEVKYFSYSSAADYLSNFYQSPDGGLTEFKNKKEAFESLDALKNEGVGVQDKRLPFNFLATRPGIFIPYLFSSPIIHRIPLGLLENFPEASPDYRPLESN